jgi:HJR/Mrr/RecB family endonuclease
MVVTNSYFTNSAKELANANKVELSDRDTLKVLVEQYGKKVK